MSVRRNLLHRTATFGILAVIVPIAVGCSSDEEVVVTTAPTTAPTTTSSAPDVTEVPTVPMFGDLISPCGPATSSGAPSVAEGQNGSSPLKLGLASDHGFPESADAPESGAPGIEMLDAARAFALWCNEQGGIRGLPIEIVDLDARVSGVPLAMEQACAEVFALVGGGWTLDEQMFPRFHECGMVSFPAFTVSAAASMANGTVQAIPTPIDREATTWLRWVADTYSSAVDDIAIIHADVPATRTVAERLAATMEIVGDFGDPLLIPYDPSGAADWSAIVEQMQSSQIGSVSFIGDPNGLVALYGAMRTGGFTPEVVFGEADLVNDVIATASETESFDNLRLRSIHGPFGEAEPGSGVGAYLEMMRIHGSIDSASSSGVSPGATSGRVGSLGLYTTSAMLLFVSAANACLDLDGNALERECILARAQSVTSWTAGGAHAATDPSTRTPTSCMLVLGVEAGAWIRVFPLLGSSDDVGNGWSCDDDNIVSVEGDFGDVTAGVDSTRLN